MDNIEQEIVPLDGEPSVNMLPERRTDTVLGVGMIRDGGVATNAGFLTKVDSGVMGAVTPLELFDRLATTDTAQVLTAATNQKALDLIANNDKVKDRVEQAASDIIDTHLVTEQATAQARQNEATFVVNSEACKVYGVNKPVHKWQQKMLVWGSGFWFIVYFVVASVTVAPISTFALKLNVIFKNIWVAILVAVVVYVGVVVLIPLIIRWVG